MLNVIYVGGKLLKDYNDFNLVEELNGIVTVSFNSINSIDNEGHNLLNEEEVIYVNKNEFRIKQLTTDRYKKHVVAVSTFFDISHIFKYEIYGGTKRITDFIYFALKNTGWKYRLYGKDDYYFIANYGNDNSLKLLNAVVDIAKLNYKILSDEKRIIFFTEEYNENIKRIFRLGINTDDFTYSIDTTSLKTKITGYGNNKKLKVEYTSPMADIYGIIEEDPVYYDDILDKDILLNEIKKVLNDTPDIDINMNTYDVSDLEVGDLIGIYYEPLDIKFKSRVLNVVKNIVGGNIVVTNITLGNTKRDDYTDLMAKQIIEIDENNRQNTSLIEQTNDYIKLKVESIEGDIAHYVSEFTMTSEEIRAEVSAVEKGLDYKIERNHSQILQQADLIELKVEQYREEYEGGISEAFSLIEQTAEEINLKVNKNYTYLDGKIDTQAAEFKISLDEISSTLTHEINSLDDRVYNTETQIKQLPNMIELSVSEETKYLDDRINNSNSRITMLSDNITSEVTKINSEMQEQSSQIIQMSDSISSKVSVGDVISEINQSADTVQIKAEKIQMDGITELNNDVYLAGGFAGQENASLHFGGRKANAIALNSIEGAVLQVWTPAGYTHFTHGIQVDGLTQFNDIVDFSKANVVGLSELIRKVVQQELNKIKD